MVGSEEPKPVSEEPCLPEELAERLSSMHDARVFVPDEIDQAVMSRAQEQFGARPDMQRRLWVRFAAPIAAAAVIALGVWVAWPGAGAGVDTASHVVRGDADRSGAVDILDAFAMARVIDTGGPTPPDWDMTGDGLVDQDDVSAVAEIAVSLSGGSGIDRGSPS